MKKSIRIFGGFLLAAAFSVGAVAQTAGNASLQSQVTQRLAARKEFRDVGVTVRNGIATLSGSVDLYQEKLDAAKQARKTPNLQGVRNLIVVNVKAVPDSDLARQLDRKLYYDPMGYDIAFNFVTASVKNGGVTLAGLTRDQFDHDSALLLVSRTAGVKDVVDNITVAPVSTFDDQIRFSTLRAIYRDPVLGRYAIDPAKPIRIVVDNGKLSLYGTVANAMDKQIAGMRASQASGAFTVQNNLEVANKG